MNTRYFFPPDSLCNSASLPPPPPPPLDGGRSRSSRGPHSSSAFLIRAAMRISRARWFAFLRRVFHYQNGSTSDLGSNPFNSTTWMMMELFALLVQIGLITFTLSVSKSETPIWPMRIWIVGYNFGCVLSLLILFCRYHRLSSSSSSSTSSSSSSSPDDPADLEQQHQINQLESTTRRYEHLLNKCRTCVELFFAIWFVMGNVWVFDSRMGSFHGAPKLHVLCITLLAWNAIAYSFPFLLFVLLCCCVPLVSNLLGYNMNMASVDRGASDDQISRLPTWRFKQDNSIVPINAHPHTNHLSTDQNPECCICLSKYQEKEEVRQLPCSHMFHLRCVDQWLRIISCCPLCKQEIEIR